MSTEPRQPQGTTGVIHIDSQHPSFGQSRAPEFLVSFGGKKDGMGAFYLGRAAGCGCGENCGQHGRLGCHPLRLLHDPRQPIAHLAGLGGVKEWVRLGGDYQEGVAQLVRYPFRPPT
jgi:hypothetical protein